jgi:hypothetical protein
LNAALATNLFYVLAFGPAGEPNQFFVLSQQKVAALIQAELAD